MQGWVYKTQLIERCVPKAPLLSNLGVMNLIATKRRYDATMRCLLLCSPNTSCGTVVLQRSLDLSSGPRRQRSTRVGLLCFWFVLARTPVANVELFGCKPVFFRGSNLALGFSSSENFDFGKRRSCLCRRASRSVFAMESFQISPRGDASRTRCRAPCHPSGASLPLAPPCVPSARPGPCVPTVSALVWLASKLRRAPRALDAELHAIRQDRCRRTLLAYYLWLGVADRVRCYRH